MGYKVEILLVAWEDLKRIEDWLVPILGDFTSAITLRF